MLYSVYLLWCVFKVGILYRKCYKNANTATLLKLYLSCIRPDLEYAAPVWSPHQKGQIDDLESVQKLALRICTRKWDTNYHDLLAANNIPSLSKRRLFLRLCLLYNFVKGTCTLHEYEHIEIKEFHHYSRSHSLTLKVPYARTNTFLNSFLCDTARQWNALPSDIIIESCDVNHFKSRLLVHFRNMH